MKTEWILEVIYTGLDDPAYAADLASLEKQTGTLEEAVRRAGDMGDKEAAGASRAYGGDGKAFLSAMFIHRTAPVGQHQGR